MSLASTEDVAARLGREIATGELPAVEFLLDAADNVIAEVGGVATGDLDGEQTPGLRFIAADLVCRALANPQGLRSLQEQLGQYSSSVQFRDLLAGGGLELTPDERRRVRRIFGLGIFAAVTLETPYSGTSLDEQPELPLP